MLFVTHLLTHLSLHDPPETMRSLTCEKSGNYVGRVEGEDAGSDQLLNVNFIKSTESSVCSGTWKSWPSDSARALESENIIVFRLFPAIGNLFLSLRRLIWVSSRHRYRLYKMADVLQRKQILKLKDFIRANIFPHDGPNLPQDPWLDPRAR